MLANCKAFWDWYEALPNGSEFVTTLCGWSLVCYYFFFVLTNFDVEFVESTSTDVFAFVLRALLYVIEIVSSC